MKIVHVVTGLNGGGAQYFLYRLLKNLPARFQCEVISLHNVGIIGELIQQVGIPVTALGMARGAIDIPRSIRLASLLKKSKPDIVHTWMHHSDLLGGLAARLAGIDSVLWAIMGDLDKRYTKRSTRAVGHVCAALSGIVPKEIVSCGNVIREAHIAFGYKADKIAFIPIGFDISGFRPDPQARARIRAELGFSDGTPVAGMMARFHEQKGHKDFCAIARRVLDRNPGVRFVLGGNGVDAGNAVLAGWIAEAGIQSVVTLLGRRDDMARVLNSFDVLVSPSLGEGFPLIIGESMASGVPCVATDVGDTGYMIADTGVATPSGDLAAMTEGILRILSLTADERLALGAKARARIVDNFEIGRVVAQYEELYDRLVMDRAKKAA